MPGGTFRRILRNLGSGITLQENKIIWEYKAFLNILGKKKWKKFKN